MMRGLYILDGETPIPCEDINRWTMEWHKDRVIKQTLATKHHFVSTVFLGINHSLNDKHPVLFETMIFTSKTCEKAYENFQERYTTYKEAIKRHDEIVNQILNHNFKLR